MNLKTYDQAFVDKLGAYPIVGRGNVVDIGLQEDGVTPKQIDVFFDIPEEWWDDKYALPAMSVRRLGLVPDPRRFMPGYKKYELSDNPDTPNTFNRSAAVPWPVTILYGVELAANSQSEMNELLGFTMLRLPAQGYGTTINAFGHSMPFRANSIQNKTDKKAKEGRKFVWEFTYAVEAWVVSTECVKVPQILQVDLTIKDEDETYSNEVTVNESGLV